MDESPRCEDDATLVRRIVVDRDESALAELLALHVPKVTGHLRRQFRHQLNDIDIDQAVNNAAMKFWENPNRFNAKKKFGPWFLTVAQRKAIDILRGESRRPTSELEFDPPAHDAEDSDEEPDLAPRVAWYMEQLEQIIDHELSGFAQAVARADLAAGGPGAADTQWLMRQHKKNKNVVQATRSRVWKKIRETLLKREALRNRAEVNQ